MDLTIDPNDTDEPYAEVIISISPIWIGSLLKYELVTHHDSTNILESLYRVLLEYENSNLFLLYTSVT